MRYRTAGRLPWLLPSLLLLALPIGSAGAQRTLRTVVTDLGDGVADMLYVWSSPVRADGRDWAVAGLATAGILALGALDGEVDQWMADHPSSAVIQALDPFREGHDMALVDLGSPKRLLPLGGLLYIVGFAADSRALRDAALGCTSAQQAQAGIQMVALHIVQRERPRTANGDPLDMAWGVGPWDRHSFYSGHASTIMSCVSYWNERFHMGWVEPALYAIAVGVGVGRMADQRHWASDVATGMILGYAVGTTVGRRARKRVERGRTEALKTGVLDRAYLGGGAGGIRVGSRIEF